MAWDCQKLPKRMIYNTASVYAEVSQFILDYVQSKPFLLIERVASKVADQLQQRFGISWLRLKLSKLKAVAQANNVGIIVERGELK